MVKETVEISIANALEVRPVAMLVQQASQFNSSIYIEKGNKSFNAKSIMGMMTLGLTSGESLTIKAEGNDEEVAITAIVNYLTGKTE